MSYQKSFHPTEDGDRGINLRDWFAGQVIGAVFSDRPLTGNGDLATTAWIAYEVADALLVQKAMRDAQESAE